MRLCVHEYGDLGPRRLTQTLTEELKTGRTLIGSCFTSTVLHVPSTVRHLKLSMHRQYVLDVLEESITASGSWC